MPPDELRVRLLGGLDVEGVAEKEIGSRKARTLVKLLALARGAPVGADRVVDALWGDDPPARPVDQVGVLVSRLRPVVGPDRLARSDAGWSLALDWLDVAELEARVDEAVARLDAGRHAAAVAAARAALELVRGELLADEPDAPWADADRAGAARVIARARVVAAEAALASGRPADAAAEAESALDHDPYDEAALRVLMRAHAAAARPASALAAYARARARLAEDLGVDPVAETESLHTAILLGQVGSESPATVTIEPRSTVIAGRAAELAELDRWLAVTAAGRAAAVVVEGEAGIGKTTLLDRWTETVATGALVLAGRSDALGRGLPLQPVLDGLAAHLRGMPAEDTAAVLGDAAPLLAPLLGGLVPVPGPAPTTVTDAAAGQATLFAALLDVIERAAQDRPAVVVVEDAHHAGPSTFEWLAFAVRRGRRLLVVASQRPAEGPTLTGAAVIRLAPLDLDAVAELVGAERAAELHARSGGHPLFLVELAAAGPGELPASVRDAVATRVDGLGDAATTLRSAAVLGTEVDIDLLAGVLALPVPVLLEHVEAGVRARLIEDRANVLGFTHDVVRDALVAGTNAARRAFVHRQAARVLNDRPRHDPLDVAFHAQRGGDVETAAAAYIEAAAVAFDRFDTATAEGLLDQAIALSDSASARLARARVRFARWNTSGARVDAKAALDLGAGAEGFEVAAWVEYYRRDYDLAFEYAEEAVERSADEGLRSSCLAVSGRVLHAAGDLAGAEQRLVDAVAIAPVSVRGFARVWLAGLRMHQGRTEESSELVERALADGTWLGHPFAVHHGNFFRVLALGQLGRPMEAMAAADMAHDTAEAAGDQGVRFVVGADNIRSWILRGVGRLGEADEWSTRVCEMTTADGTDLTAEMRCASMLDLIEGRLLAGDLDGAEAAVHRATPVASLHGTMAWHHRQRYGVQQARLALAAGDAARAIELASASVDDAAARGSARYELLGRVVVARATAEMGAGIDYDAVDAVLARLDDRAGMEAWLVTAELAAVAGVERWWRDAERRAGALVAAAGPDGESLRTWVASRFAALGRT